MTTALIATVLIEAVILAWYFRYRDSNIGKISDINILMFALFSPKLAEYGPVVSNVGCIWYAAVMAGQAMICETQGRQAAWATTGKVLRTLTIVMALVTCLDAVPPVVGDPPAIEAAIDAISPRSLNTVAATYLAFCAGQMVLITLMGMLAAASPFWRILVATIFAQGVDTLVFFPIAFGSLPLRDIGHIATGGMAVKTVLAVLFAGVIVACIRWIKPVSP